MTDAREIANLVTAAFHESERQHREATNPAPIVESPTDADPAIGHGTHIPSVGNQPSALPTQQQLIELAEQSGDRALALQLKNQLLVEQFEHTHGPQPK